MWEHKSKIFENDLKCGRIRVIGRSNSIFDLQTFHSFYFYWTKGLTNIRTNFNMMHPVRKKSKDFRWSLNGDEFYWLDCTQMVGRQCNLLIRHWRPTMVWKCTLPGLDTMLQLLLNALQDHYFDLFKQWKRAL